MFPQLRLNFNERSDFISPLDKEYPFDKSLWQYPERQPLEKQIADLYELTPTQVLCTNGGDEAIMILMRIIKETSQLILPQPAFSQYIWGIKSWQLKSKTIPSKKDLCIDVEATISAINKPATINLPGTSDKLDNLPGTSDNLPGTFKGTVTIITRPNNPSGELIPLPSLVRIIEASEQNNGWVFLDEAYIEFSEQSSVAKELLDRFQNLVVLRTLSKAYGLAGIRLGYLLGNEALIAEFEKRCAPFNIAQPSLKIAAKALSSSNQAEMINFCQQIIANRNLLFNWLRENKLPVLPSQANFLVLPLTNKQAKAIESFLAKNGFLLRTFNDDMSNCLRITIPYRIDRLKLLLQQALLPDLICLDMDGVLINTSGSYDATIIATVKQLSGKEVAQSEINQLKNVGGYNNDWVVTQKILQDLGIDMQLNAVIEVFQQFYIGDKVDGKNNGLVKNETAIINASLLSCIKKSTTTAFAIVTGRPLIEANAGKELIGLNELDLISLDCVTKAKPSPEGIQRLQKKYSSLSWMCGDNPDDMQAAVASNSMAIGIGNKDKEESLYQAGADIVLRDINELEDWLCPLK